MYVPNFESLEPSKKIEQCIQVIQRVLMNQQPKIIIFPSLQHFWRFSEHFLKNKLEFSLLEMLDQ
ncbi:ASN_collapsed_G0051530.mRNA.1.CDS.1 [Saccharomyces cerevisiae]|nr:ASN_collapsed_G0051530.mRNA.1.CDS.1 [Saccharomyces cerevisiae]